VVDNGEGPLGEGKLSGVARKTNVLICEKIEQLRKMKAGHVIYCLYS